MLRLVLRFGSSKCRIFEFGSILQHRTFSVFYFPFSMFIFFGFVFVLGLVVLVQIPPQRAHIPKRRLPVIIGNGCPARTPRVLGRKTNVLIHIDFVVVHTKGLFSLLDHRKEQWIFPIPEGETDEVCQLSIWSDANNRNAF